MEWTFGRFLWAMVVFFFWFAVIWMFVSVFADILRRDMSGWAKAGWSILIVVLPFLGILIYLIARPKGAEPYGWSTPTPHPPIGRSAADEIATAAQLHDEGKITAEEFERLKRRALA